MSMAGSALEGQSETPEDGVKSSGNVERNKHVQSLYGKMIFNTFLVSRITRNKHGRADNSSKMSSQCAGERQFP